MGRPGRAAGDLPGVLQFVHPARAAESGVLRGGHGAPHAHQPRAAHRAEQRAARGAGGEWQAEPRAPRQLRRRTDVHPLQRHRGLHHALLPRRPEGGVQARRRRQAARHVGLHRAGAQGRAVPGGAVHRAHHRGGAGAVQQGGLLRGGGGRAAARSEGTRLHGERRVAAELLLQPRAGPAAPGAVPLPDGRQAAAAGAALPRHHQRVLRGLVLPVARGRAAQCGRQARAQLRPAGLPAAGVHQSGGLLRAGAHAGRARLPRLFEHPPAAGARDEQVLFGADGAVQGSVRGEAEKPQRAGDGDAGGHRQARGCGGDGVPHERGARGEGEEARRQPGEDRRAAREHEGEHALRRDEEGSGTPKHKYYE
eukprot:121444-Pyramimonas_sp.AAC.2